MPTSSPPMVTFGSVFGRSLTTGFAAAVAMWVIWFLTHLPGLILSPMAVGLAVLATLFVVCFVSASLTGEGTVKSALLGLLAGGISGVVNLLLLGSFLVRPDADGGSSSAVPGAAVAVGGFLLFSGLAGLVGAAMGSAVPMGRGRPLGAGSDLPRFAVVAAVSVFPLLLLGGLVTSTASGMAVPDWPGTYGGNMFLYPISLMTRPRVFLEHSHRLFGTLVGVTMIALLLYTLVAERRVGVKVIAGVLLALVISQGVLGGTRVTENSRWLAVFHGVFAQVFFAMVVAFAAWLSPLVSGISSSTPGSPVDRRIKSLGTAALHTTIIQLVFGAMYRHMGSPHALWTHAAFAMVVLVLVLLAAGASLSRAGREGQDPRSPTNTAFRRLGVGLLVVVLVQFLLGWAAFFAVGMGRGKGEIPIAEEAITAPSTPWWEALIPTLHQANGAVLIALLTINWVLARRVWKAVGGPRAGTTPRQPSAG